MTHLLSTSLELGAEGVLWIPLALISPGELQMGMQALPGGEPGERLGVRSRPGRGRGAR
jgi:hypothetical protein